MKKIMYICDRCKKVITDNVIGKINAEEVDRETYKSIGGYVNEDILDPLEFCKECLEVIAHLIEQECDNTPMKLTKAEGEPRMSFAEMLEEDTKQIGIEEVIEQMSPEKEEIAPVHTKKPRGRGNSSVDTKRILELLADGVQGKKIAELCDCQTSTVSMVKRIYTLDEDGKVRRKAE